MVVVVATFDVDVVVVGATGNGNVVDNVTESVTFALVVEEIDLTFLNVIVDAAVVVLVTTIEADVLRCSSVRSTEEGSY